MRFRSQCLACVASTTQQSYSAPGISSAQRCSGVTSLLLVGNERNSADCICFCLPEILACLSLAKEVTCFTPISFLHPVDGKSCRKSSNITQSCCRVVLEMPRNSHNAGSLPSTSHPLTSLPVSAVVADASQRVLPLLYIPAQTAREVPVCGGSQTSIMQGVWAPYDLNGPDFGIPKAWVMPEL